MRRARTTAAVLLLGLGLLAGCGSQDATTPTAGGDSSSSAPPSSTSAAPSPSQSASSTPSQSGVDTSAWPTGDRDKSTSGGDRAGVLRSIRTGTHDGYDRVVFELSRPFGGYHIGYVDKVTTDPSGKPVPLEGSAFLQVVLYNATTDNAFQIPPGKHQTYPGPDTVTPDLDQVEQVSVAGDFEATLSFGIGLASKTGYQVKVLTSPSRLVIDIAHS